MIVELGAPEAWRLGAELVWLPTAAEMTELDREAVASGATTERTLIEAAGREVARRVQHFWPSGRIVALAGSGHNGADALVALRTLAAWGRDVRAVQAGSSPPRPDVLIGWDLPLQDPARMTELCAGASVVLDGILGTGVSGPAREPQAGLIRRLNALELPVVAVDGPSGADFSTGAVDGECVRADLTVGLGWPNLGLLRYPAREYCGRLEAVEIGFPPPAVSPAARAITGRWVQQMLIPRPKNAHKGRAGYLALVAGQTGMAGACLLGARAALRGGVGILKAIGDPANREIVQRSVPGAIFVPWDQDAEVAAAVSWAGALAIGPGLGRGDERRALVEQVLAARGERPAVLDADALTAFDGDGAGLSRLVGPRDVITPHPGELARVTGRSVEEIVADPLTAAREAAAGLGCVVLLKGAPSLVARDDAPLRVSTTGGPAVAAGGTGDVLTGLIGAYLAAGTDPADAASAALFLTGVAARASAQPVGHLASDLPDRLPGVRHEVETLGTPAGPLIFASAP